MWCRRYRFDDRSVDTYDHLKRLEKDCFGGKRTEMVWDYMQYRNVEQKVRPPSRNRRPHLFCKKFLTIFVQVEVSYSGYILFYERVGESGTIPFGPVEG